MAGVYSAPFPTAYRYGWSEAEATRFALQELDYLFATATAPGQVAAMVIEPVLGEGGYIPANTEFLTGIAERAREHGILLVLDEVQTGFGRTGQYFGHQHFGVTPDVLVMAKESRAVPHLGHRCLRRVDGACLAGFAGRYLRGQRRRTKRCAGHST